MNSTGNLPDNMRLFTLNIAGRASASNTNATLTQHLVEEGVGLMANDAISPSVTQSPSVTFRQIPDGVIALGKPSATHLYAVMLQIGRRNRSITASWNVLAKASDMNRKTVQAALAILIAHGYVTTTHRSSDGRKASDSITLHQVSVVQKTDHMVEKTDKPMVQKTDRGGVKNGPLNGYVTDTSRYVIGDTPAESPVSQLTEEPMATDRGTRLPDGFTLNDKMRADAQRLGIDYDLDWQVEAFIDHHTAEGKPSKSWEASWRTWCRNAMSWNKRGPRPVATAPAAPPVEDKVAKAKAEKERLLAGRWQGQREALMYAPKSDGPENVARRIAELDRIINGAVAA